MKRHCLFPFSRKCKFYYILRKSLEISFQLKSSKHFNFTRTFCKNHSRNFRLRENQITLSVFAKNSKFCQVEARICSCSTHIFFRENKYLYENIFPKILQNLIVSQKSWRKQTFLQKSAKISCHKISQKWSFFICYWQVWNLRKRQHLLLPVKIVDKIFANNFVFVSFRPCSLAGVGTGQARTQTIRQQKARYSSLYCSMTSRNYSE